MPKWPLVGSGPKQLTREDLKKIGIGALFAAATAGLTYVGTGIEGYELGVYAPLIAAAVTVLANVARKYLTDNRKTDASQLRR